jgi:hypothetical protein
LAEVMAAGVWALTIPRPGVCFHEGFMRLGLIMPVWIHQSYELLGLTYRCVEKLRTSTQAHLWVVCNRLHLITPTELQQEMSVRCHFPLTVLHQPGVERSVAGAWNHGCRHALAWGAERLLILNNDVLVEPDCLDTLLAFHQQGVAIWSGINTWDRTVISPALVTDGADFSCLMLTPDTLARHGWFDEEFRPAYFEDNDYYARVVLGGEECRVVHAARFCHNGSRTIRLEPEAAHHVHHWWGANRARFQAKWGIEQPANCAEEVRRLYYRRPFNQ